MKYTKDYQEMYSVGRCMKRGPAPIPQDGKYQQVTQIDQISGFSHSVGTCAMKQGACKLTTNVKGGVIQEVLIEVIGCSGMTQSASMASEILPGKTLLEALNTDLVCDAINVAMREHFLNLAYGRSQSAFSQEGLAVGSAMEDLSNGKMSMVGTAYGTAEKGPRYLQIAEGYVRRLALDDNDRIIGYEYTNVGEMMQQIENGVPAEQALKASTGVYGRYDEAVKRINPREE